VTQPPNAPPVVSGSPEPDRSVSRRAAGLAPRLVASGALVVAAVTFLLWFGPRPTPVYADVYVPLARAAGFLAPPPGGAHVRMSTALVNGQVFKYIVGQSKLNLETVLKHYEEQFQTTETTSGTRLRTARRLNGKGAGVVTGILRGPVTHPQDVNADALEFARTTRLGALGQFHVIAAYASQGTVFIDFMPADDVRLDQLFPKGKEDAPGSDLEGVRRPAGLQRFLTIEHGSGQSLSRTRIYRAENSVAAVAEFGGALAAGGWKPNTAFDSSVVRHFTYGQRDCLVGGASEGRDAFVILVDRYVTGLGQQP